MLLELAQQNVNLLKGTRGKKTLLKEIGDLKRPISGRRLNGLIVPFSCRQNSMEDYVFGFGGREEPQPKKGGIIRDTGTEGIL